MAERLSARAIIGTIASDFDELDPGPHESAWGTVDGPIGWPGYDKSRAGAIERTGEIESVVCGLARIGDIDAVVISFEFGFLGGSVGGHTGLMVETAFARAVRLRVPVVSLISTGGSRMQEGMRALSQLHRMARAGAVAWAEGIPQIAVLRNPATGGGWATLGAGSDVVLGVKGAQVGFAGSRVRPEGETDLDAYTADGQYAAGHVDELLEPDEVPAALRQWLTLLRPTAHGELSAPPVPGASSGVSGAQGGAQGNGSPVDLPEDGWAAVQRARAAERPRAEAYLDAYFEQRRDIRGDRCGGVDPGVRCGFGVRDGQVVAYAAQCGTATLPSGFRTAARLVRMAGRLGVPVLTLVDTPGAANDAAAERSGAGPAIAELFSAIATATVPITSLVIGEGGSGGALAFAAPGRMWATSDSYFAVTSPEAAARILKRPPEDVPLTADQLRLRPQDLVELGIANGVVNPLG